MQQITLRLPEEMLESVDEEAEEHGETRSDYLRDVIESRNERTDGGGEGGENTDDSGESAAVLRERVIRLEVENEHLEENLERVRDERDSLRARLGEARGKLKLHHSEEPRDGVLTRMRRWVVGDTAE